MRLAEHFEREEFERSEIAARNGWDNTIPDELLPNARRLASALEGVRACLDRAVGVLSGYRCEKVNQAVGSKPTSQHRRCLAADISVRGLTALAVVQAIRSSQLPLDQVILEFDQWTHVSIPEVGAAPRREFLIIDHAGTRPFA